MARFGARRVDGRQLVDSGLGAGPKALPRQVAHPNTLLLLGSARTLLLALGVSQSDYPGLLGSEDGRGAGLGHGLG